MVSSREKKMTIVQMEKMLELIEQKPMLTLSTLTAPAAKPKLKQLWDEAATVLNNEYGANKTGEKWQKAWTDWKSKTRFKVRRLSAKGGAASVKSKLNDVELKLVSLMDMLGWTSINADNTEDPSVPSALESPRDKKMSVSQMETLLHLIEKSPKLASAQGRTPCRRERTRSAWSGAALTLNADTNGPSKTGEKWQKAWIDWKSKTRFKLTQLQERADRKRAIGEHLTGLERKLVKIMGWLDKSTADSVDDDCPASPARSPAVSAPSDACESAGAAASAKRATPRRRIISQPLPAQFKRRRTTSTWSEREESMREFLELERKKVSALRSIVDAVSGLRSDLRRYCTHLPDKHSHHGDFPT